MPMETYILVAHEVIPCPDPREWGRFMEDNNARTVKQEIVMSKEHDGQVVREVTVSTVFLGLDHNWYRGRPILFETMTFGGRRERPEDLLNNACIHKE